MSEIKSEPKKKFPLDMEANEDKIRELRKYIDKNKDRPGALMPVLQECQRIFTYIPEEMVSVISSGLGVPNSDIYGVATFYSQFTFIPQGKHSISVCLGTACYVKGAAAIMDKLHEELGIGAGETSEDGMFSIVDARCLGDCGSAPVIAVDGELHPKMSAKEIPALLDKYRQE